MSDFPSIDLTVTSRASSRSRAVRPAEAVAHAGDTMPFDESSAVTYVVEYLDASRLAKPSLRRLHEAVIVLFDQHKELRQILSRLGRGAGQTENVVRRAHELKYMVREGWQFLEKAERAGIRLSFSWLHENVHGVPPAQQLTAIRAKALQLKFK